MNCVLLHENTCIMIINRMISCYLACWYHLGTCKVNFGVNGAVPKFLGWSVSHILSNRKYLGLPVLSRSSSFGNKKV